MLKSTINNTDSKRRRGRPTQAASIDKDQILKMALKCFAQYGFNGTRIKMISQMAEVDDSLLHYHFKSKENLWKEAVKMAFEDYDEDSQKVVKLFKDMDSLSWGKAVIRHFIHYNATHPELYQIVFHEMSIRSERSTYISKNVLDPYTRKVNLWHKSLSKDDLIKNIPEPNMMSIWIGSCVSHFLLHNHMQLSLNENVFSEENIEKHADTVIDVIFSGISN